MPEKNNFKEGLKGTTLFGGVGILNILISIVKSKIVAVLLGPAGMGVLGLFNSAVDLINKSTNFSLRTSAVKDISFSYATNNSEKLTRTISVFLKLISITGVLGLVVCVAFSPYLSLSSFGNYDYISSFIVLALSYPFLQFTDGLNVIMQGTRNLKRLAKSNIVGNFFSLLCVIPMYYVFGVPGIVYTIVLGYLVHFVVSYLYVKRIDYHTIKVKYKQAFTEGREMLKMGFLISLQGILVAFSAYIVRAFISNTASVDEVGLFTAGFYIVNTYTGVVFSGMSTEYYPRLASIADNNEGVFKAVNSQSELSIMFLAPLVNILIILGNAAIILLYSKEFLGITMMINISMIGMLFKAPSWCLGYVFLSKGDSKAYFWNELLAVVYTLLLNILFYKIWGLTGMGVSFLISYFVYWIQQIIVCRFLYDYHFNPSFLKILGPLLLFTTGNFLCSLSDDWFIKYLIGSIILIIICLLSYKVLKNNIDISSLKKYVLRRHE